MANMNPFYQNLKDNYLFATIKQRVSAFSEANPDKDLISLGIGDVTRPLAPAVVEAMHRAVDEMGCAEGFHGYGPDPGYAFLREAIAAGDYAARGVEIGTDEIFISDGAKSDVGNIGDIFDRDNVVLITDPVYPVYFDSNVMAGRTVRFVPLHEANGFCPVPPDFHADMIYLCSPNNPTGAAMDRDSLQAWVDYARRHDAVILFDSAYEAFITEPDIPHSIYEIEGFTGTRCAYTVVPKQLCRNGVSLNGYWARRQATKFNGVSYIVQRGAQAVYSEAGQAQIRETIAYYQENAKIIREGLAAAGFTAYGGVNAPYIWLKCPDGLKSWDLFDLLINRVYVVGTPGQGFGEQGEGYFRLTAFGTRENTCKAVERIKSLF